MSARSFGGVVLGAAVVLGALAQGFSADPGLGRMPFLAFLAVAAASALALALQLAATAWAARRIVVPDARAHAGLALAWAAVLVLIGAVLSALFAPAGLLAAIAATFILPAAAAGRAGALAGFGVVRRHPWRALTLMLGVIVLGGVSLVVSIATGLFLTGTIGGIAAWLWFGVVIAWLLLWGTRLAVREPATRPTLAE
ncbi:hypothetical protein ABXJ56_02430 [Microbacterium chocolatum]|uniref:hypothetical protein n=1 Tax=Microbacterium aurantiacum TaxID=162393 RepID=UPI00338F3DB5